MCNNNGMNEQEIRESIATKIENHYSYILKNSQEMMAMVNIHDVLDIIRNNQ